MASATFLVIGHVTKDLAGDGYTIGGGVTFAAVTASRLGYDVAVLTRAEPDVTGALTALLPRAEVTCLPSARTTTFHNAYDGAGRRVQRVTAVAEGIGPGDVPAGLRRAQVVLLAPVAGEVDPAVLEMFPRALAGLAVQGWLRCWGPDGRVYPAPWPRAIDALPRAAVAVFSDEDVAGDMEVVGQYAAQARMLAYTQGRHGSTVYVAGEPIRVPAFPTTEVDPTGAGDVFAAAFLIALRETGDPRCAARFGNCAASFAVERFGTLGIPSREQIARRLDGA
ncbi:MAG: PfkB family carbohydrate kinase [Chloroflexota bacterium]